MRRALWLRLVSVIICFVMVVPTAFAAPADSSADASASTVPSQTAESSQTVPDNWAAPEQDDQSAEKPVPEFPQQSREGIGASVDDEFPGDPLPASPVSNYLERDVDTYDIFRVWLNAGDRLDLSLYGPGTGDFDLYVYDPALNAVSWSAGVSYPELIGYTASVNGNHYVMVRAWSGYGSYTLNWTKTPRPPASNCQISLSAPGSVEWGKPLHLTAYYTEDGYPVAGKQVLIEFKPYGGSTWAVVRTLTSNSVGQAKGTYAAIRKGHYRARVSFNASRRYSAARWVAVNPYLSIKGSSSVALSKSFTVYGYLGPRHPAGSKNVILKFYRGGKLRKTVKAKNYSVTVSGKPATKYKATVKLTTPGQWTVKAEIAEDSIHNKRTVGKTIWVNKTKMSIKTNGVDVTYAKSNTISGTLRNRSGKALSGKTVRLQYMNPWGRWQTVKKLKTNSKGKVSYKVKPKESRAYRFYYAGSSKLAKSTSNWVYVTSCYAERSGYSSYEYGWWSNSVWLSKGKHQIKAYAREGLDQVYIQDSARTWGKKVNSKRLPSSKWRTYYFTVPESGWYLLGWKGNWAYNNYIKYKVW